MNPEIRAFIQALTHRVGAELLVQSHHANATQTKDDGSLVTAWDQWADAEIRTALTAQFPDHGLLTEETSHRFPDCEWCWIVDPLDGTTNFAKGIPIWGISLGLLHWGVPVFGHVYMPPLGQTFEGILDPPLALGNGIALRPASPAIGPNTFFSFCSRSLHLMTPGFPCKIRALGSAAYNFLCVANGSMVGAVEATPKIWDIAAAWVILRASGAHWLPLEKEPIFPLTPGQDYERRAFPTLVVAQPDLVPIFLPYVAPLTITRSCRSS